MNFLNLDIKTEYRSGKNSVINDFFVPVLANAVRYKRAVGFFTSSALLQISKGIAGLLKNGGKVELIVSPRLSEEDIEAIDCGYKAREEVINEAMLREFSEPKSYFEAERLNLLATLIAKGDLDIKVAFTKYANQIGIYHEKMGLIYDKDDNIVAFSGSTNETSMAFTANYEVLDTFCSWQSEFERKKVEEKEFAFHCLWSNADGTVEILDFPDIVKEKLQLYKKDVIDYTVDESEVSNEMDNVSSKKTKAFFRIPKNVTLYPYQNEAISKWEENDFKGIFDMATGSGKTYTGLSALVSLSEKLNDHLGVFIICPQVHLVEQWVEDIRNFNVEPLVCHAKYEWKKKFKFVLSDYKLGVVKHFCVIMSNSSFASEYVQENIRKVKEDICLVVDEAHNVGAQKIRNCLIDNYKYRLALSATVDRHRDEEGTKAIYNFFGKKCIEFSLKDAIQGGFLTPYYYHPVVVNLEEDELQDYVELSVKISKAMMRHNNSSEEELPTAIEQLMIKRARIVAGARQKISRLKDIIDPYRNDNNILVYCGATKYGQSQDEDTRQIEEVARMLGNDLGMRIATFTSRNNAKEREMIKDSFAEGHMLQALVAIKCLDEGVNIPGIKTAFILASSTNPKEYIQRRGRVLRKSKGKFFADIYDFITLPRPMEGKHDRGFHSGERNLIEKEYERMKDFMELCDNQAGTRKLMVQIDDYYKLNYIEGECNE